MTMKRKHILLSIFLLIIFGKWVYFICWSILKAMTLAVMVLWMLFPPTILIISLLYIAFMVFTYKVGEKKVTLYLLGFMIVFSTFFLYENGRISETKKYNQHNLTMMLTGTQYPLSEPMFEHQERSDSPRYDFSIFIYELSDDACQFFSNPPPNFNSYPKKTEDLDKWKEISWQQGPIEDNMPSILNTLFSNKGGVTRRPEKVRQIEWILQTLSKPTTYYSYFQNSTDSRDIKFYMVDLMERKLVSIQSIW